MLTPPSDQSPSRSGFTLLEVLIALMILAVIAMLSWRGLDQVFRLTDRVRAVDDNISEWRAVFEQMEQDLLRVSNKRVGSSIDIFEPLAVDFESLGMVIADTASSGPTQWLKVRWRLLNGQWVRESEPLAINDNMQQNDRSPAPVMPMRDPARILGPKAQGVRVRLWVNDNRGAGWIIAYAYGREIPPLPLPGSGAEPPMQQVLVPAVLESFGYVAAGPLAQRYRAPEGMEFRVLLPDGRIYTRVFAIGSSS